MKWIAGIVSAILIGAGTYWATDGFKAWLAKPDPVITGFGFDSATNWATLRLTGAFTIFNNGGKIARRCHVIWSGDTIGRADSPALDLPEKTQRTVSLTVQLTVRGTSSSQANLQCADGLNPSPYDVAINVESDAQGNVANVETVFDQKLKSVYKIDRNIMTNKIKNQVLTPVTNN